MPFTFLAHQSFVLPLKWARPRWFDGTALCVGSMAPDLTYLLDNTRWEFASHNLDALLRVSLPLTIVLTLLFRHRIAEPLGAHLPGALGTEVRALARANRPLAMTAGCGLLGALSHVFVDGFTHRDGWATARWVFLREGVRIGTLQLPLASLLQYAGHVFGTLGGLLMLALLVRGHRFSQWNGVTAPAPFARRPLRFWLPVALGAVAALGVGGATLYARAAVATAIIRAAWTAFAGLWIAASAWPAPARSPAVSDAPSPEG